MHMRKKNAKYFLLIMLSIASGGLFLNVAKADIKSDDSSSVVQQKNNAEIYVFPIKLDKSSYVVGADVSGSFVLSNIGAVDVTDAYYTISIGDKNGLNLIGETVKKSLTYIKGSSKRVVNFNYSLPKTVSGDSFLVIKVYLQDGTVLANGTQGVYVQGEPQSKIVAPGSVATILNNKIYDKDYGLVVGSKDNLVVSFSFSTSTEPKNAVLSVYAKDIDSDPVKTVEISKLVKDKNGKYEVGLPTGELSPDRYIAKISFDNLLIFNQ